MNARLKALTSTTLAALGIAQAAESEPAAVIIDPPVEDPAEDEPADEPADAAAAEAEAAAADADVAAAITLAATQSAAKATAAANARWADVLGSDAAKGRTAQATALLANTALDAAGVKAALAAFPKEAAATFADRMAGVENPPVTAGAGGDENAAKAGNYGWDNVVAKAFPKTAAK